MAKLLGANGTLPKAKPARRAKATGSKAAAKDNAIVIEIPELGTADEAKATLANCIPGWDDISKEQQAELAEIAVGQRKQRQPVRVTLTRKPSGGMSIGIAGKSEALGLLKLQRTFAAVSMDPVNARANELLKYLGSVNADNADRYNAALSFIESMEPQNQAEALLLVQMYVTHDAAIRALSQLGAADWIPQAQTFGNLATKLLRTSQGQMETLGRMRRGGEQVVKHIHVDNRGGQAVIAETVTNGGSENGKISDQCQTAGTLGSIASLPSPDPLGNGVPISGREREAAMQDARRDKSGRA